MKLMIMAAAAALSTCGQAAETETQAATAQDGQAQSVFEWTISVDPSGYYLPSNGLTAGGWVVEHIFLPAPFEFEAWRDTGADPAEVPVWVEAHPQGAEPATNAMGRQYFPEAVRVRPDRLIIEDGRFTFEADGGPTGGILISGQIQPEHLQGDAAQPDDQGQALIGGAEIGGERIRNVSFMHWHGD